jgi:hypothetical protein
MSTSKRSEEPTKNWAYFTILFQKSENSKVNICWISKLVANAFNKKISYASYLEDPLTLFARFLRFLLDFLGFMKDFEGFLRFLGDILEFSHSI